MNTAIEPNPVKIYEINNILIDLYLQEIAHGTEIVRPEKEVFETLIYFLEHRDQLVTVETLQAHLGPNAEVSEFEVLRNIAKVRHALNDDESKDIIKFDPEEQGYRFDGDVLEMEIQ